MNLIGKKKFEDNNNLYGKVTHTVNYKLISCIISSSSTP